MKKTFNLQRMMALVACALTLCMFSSCVKEVTYGRIQGIVTNANDNEPIQGVNISLSPTGLSTVTGSDGRYEFNGLAAGQYTVQATATGYQSNTKTIEITAGNIASGDMNLKPEVAGFKLNVESLDFQTSFSQLPFKIINISNSLPVNWSITESYNWLTATPNSGTLRAGEEVGVIVDIDRTKIDQSTTAQIVVECAEMTVVLPVNVTISGSNGAQLQLSTNALDFGTSATSLRFDVMNSGPANTSLNWVCSPIQVDWLTITPSSGNTAGGSTTAVAATIDRSKFTGNVSTQITISGAGSSASISINASSEGQGIAIMELSTGALDFGDDEVTKTFLVKNVGSAGTVLDWSISAFTENWLAVTPMSGIANANGSATVTVSVDRTKFTGQVHANITVNSSSGSRTVSVSASNFQSVLAVTPTALDFGKAATSKTLTIKNEGDQGASLSWSVATPAESWLTVSPMSGTATTTTNATVTVKVDRNAFVGVKETSIQITGAGTTKTIPVAIDNSVLVTEGLFCYFDFDNESQIVDWAGNYTGVNSGTTASDDTPSEEGYSRQFDGSSFIMVNGSIISPGGPFSVNLWYKTGSNNQYLIGSDSSGDSFRECTFQFTNTQNFRYEAGDKSGSWSDLTWTSGSVASYIDNQWHMLTMTYDGNIGVLYLDGQLFETKVTQKLAWGTGTNTPVRTSFFGINNNTGNYTGKMDNFRSYNRALSAEEVQTLFNAKQ